MGKFVGIATLFIGGLMLADALTHPSGVQALGSASNALLGTGGNQLIGVAATSSKVNQ
jgi:hypothetical protein